MVFECQAKYIGAPIRKGEEPIAYVQYQDRYYFPLYDRKKEIFALPRVSVEDLDKKAYLMSPSDISFKLGLDSENGHFYDFENIKLVGYVVDEFANFSPVYDVSMRCEYTKWRLKRVLKKDKSMRGIEWVPECHQVFMSISCNP